MGSRVNYVVVRDGGYTVFSQGGGAGQGIDYFFAVGPEVVLRWLANLGDFADGHWFDDVGCEGGVLLDVDRRVLLLFNTVYNSVVYRVAMLQAYAATWPGWEIRWAYDGIADLMSYVGVDPAGARRDLRAERTERNEFAPDDQVAAVVTIRGDDGRVRLYGLNPDLAWLRWHTGPGLVEWVAAGPELPESAESMPAAGLDLDPSTRWAGLWTVEPLCGLRQQWTELWPGWTLEFWGDDMARQAVHDPDRLYDSIRPSSIARDRGVLAKRVQDHWSVRSTILARGISAEELQRLYEWNFGGIRSQLDADVTAEEIERIAALLRGPQISSAQFRR